MEKVYNIKKNTLQNQIFDLIYMIPIFYNCGFTFETAICFKN